MPLTSDWQGWSLFLKSRRAIPLVVGLIGVAIGGRLIGDYGFKVGQVAVIPVPWAALLPTISAYALAGSAVPMIPAIDGLASRPILRYQFIYLCCVGTLNCLLLWWATAPLPGDLGAPAVVRNFVGLLGLSLISAIVLKVAVGWIVPLVAFFAAIFLGGNDGSFRPAGWLIEGDNSISAALIAAGFCVIGFAAAANTRFRIRFAGL